MRTLTRKAYAKVNLSLDVLRKREDGYHDLKMIMQNLSLCDELTFTVADQAGDITMSANHPGIPTDDRNLIIKAARLMYNEFSLDRALHINLDKQIPVEAGMAGGSTDCAATLHAINELFNLGLSNEDLRKLGVRLGADVPFCVLGKTALSEGIGDILTPVAPLTDCFVLVAKPPVSVSTGEVYGNLRANELTHHPDVDAMISALEAGDINRVGALMENVLETVTILRHPEIEAIKKLMISENAVNSLMSGSGPTVFGIFKSKEAAIKAKESIFAAGLSDEVYITVPVSEQ